MDHQDFRAAHERRIADSVAERLPTDMLELYKELRHVGRFFFTKFDTVGVWVANGGASQKVETLKLVGAAADLDEGLAVTVEDGAGNRQTVNHVPQQLFTYPVFVWLPYYNDIRMVPTLKRGFTLSTNVVFRSAHQPSHKGSNVFLRRD